MLTARDRAYAAELRRRREQRARVRAAAIGGTSSRDGEGLALIVGLPLLSVGLMMVAGLASERR
jgi:hypothetical protein